MEIQGWLVNVSKDGQTVSLRKDGSPGEIRVESEDDGFAVDIWSDDTSPVSMATASARYTELERE